MAESTNEEAVRQQKISDAVWNYLGLRDPGEVSAWIAGAITELSERRAAEAGT